MSPPVSYDRNLWCYTPKLCVLQAIILLCVQKTNRPFYLRLLHLFLHNVWKSIFLVVLPNLLAFVLSIQTPDENLCVCTSIQSYRVHHWLKPMCRRVLEFLRIHPDCVDSQFCAYDGAFCAMGQGLRCILRLMIVA